MIGPLTEQDRGRWVTYKGNAGEVEHGRIKGWSGSVVWVVYGWSAEQSNWRDYTGQATDYDDLSFKEE